MTQPRVRCKKCRKVKALSRFSRDKSRPSGHFPWCKTCQNESTQAVAFQDESAPLNGHICPMCGTPVRGHANRRFCSLTCKDRVRRLKLNYNLSPEQFRALVDATGGICPICLKKPTSWHVEHNHKTRQVMGVVDAGCNVGAIARTYHDIEMVRRLLDYLENPPAVKVLGEVVLVPEQANNQKSNVHKVWQFNNARRRRR